MATLWARRSDRDVSTIAIRKLLQSNEGGAERIASCRCMLEHLFMLTVSCRKQSLNIQNLHLRSFD